MADCSFSLALCTENKCFSTIYYVLVGHDNLWIPLSDTGKSMVKTKSEEHPRLSNYYCHYGYYIRIILIIIIMERHCERFKSNVTCHFLLLKF